MGEHRPVGLRRGSSVPLRHAGEIVGMVVRTRARVRPLYVSPGHRIGIEEATRYVIECCRGFRLPEPVRQADIAVGKARRRRVLDRASAPRKGARSL